MPALGKTTLLNQFSGIARERDYSVHDVAVFDFGVGKGQDAIGVLARQLLGIPPGTAKDIRRQTAETACLGSDWNETETAEFDASLNAHDNALELTRTVKMKRFEAVGLLNSARCRYLRGERELAADLAREAVDICRDTGMEFCGPGVLGMLGLVSDAEEERDAALEEAEAILSKGWIGHNH